MNYFTILKKSIPVLAGILMSGTAAMAQLSPHDAVKAVGRGINLGNTLDAPYEGDWAPKAEEYYFDAYKKAGFQSVRIPVTWNNHTAKTPPYTVKKEFMDRVEQVVDWALERDLVVVLNAHHEAWLKEDYTKEDAARIDSIWVQISERFKDKSDSLLFEPINEPHGTITKTEVEVLNARILGIIRKTNPTRNVILSGDEWSAIKDLLEIRMPDDDYLIGYHHTYDPWKFAGEFQGTWGTSAERKAVADDFKRVKEWSDRTGIPAIVDEFGCRVEADYNSRMMHYATYVEESLKNGVSFMVWDDHGWFKVYDRINDGWDEVKDILIHFSSLSPENVNLEVIDGKNIQVTWENRHTTADSIVVEKKVDDQYVPIKTLDKAATSYTEEGVKAGRKHNYRVVVKDGEKVYMSYPQQKYVMATERSPYKGTPAAIPGTLEAEAYDEGGEGLTYSDTDETNNGKAFREDAVDIEAREEGGFQVGYLEKGEWLEYTVEVAKEATYKLIFHVASMEGGGKLAIEVVGADNQLALEVPATNSWTALTTVEGKLALPAGTQRLRLSVIATPAYNIDKVVFEESTPDILNTEVPVASARSFASPNPVLNSFVFYADAGEQISTASLLSLDGKVLAHFSIVNGENVIDMRKFEQGIYLLRYQGESGWSQLKLVKK